MKKTKQQAVISEQKYRFLFDNMLDGFACQKIIFNKQGEFVDCIFLEVNYAFERVTGLKRKAVIGKKITEAIPGIRKELTGWIDKYAKALLSGKQIRFETFVSALKRWYSVSAYSPEKGYFLTVFKDITRRKQLEEKLKKANEDLEERVKKRTEDAVAQRQRLYSVLETLPAYVVLLDKDYRVPFANKFFRERFGESHGRRCYDYLFNKKAPCEGCETYKAMDSNAPHRWEWTGPDGRNYDIYDYPFVDADGSAMILEMGIDITERKQAEAELKAHQGYLEELVKERTADLRANEQRLSRAQKIAHLGSWELDLADNKLTWSDEVYRIFGLKPQEFKATYEAFLERVHPDDRKAVDSAYSNSIQEGKDSYEIEHRVVRKSSDEIRYVHEKCQHFRDKSGKIIRSVGMVQDVTDKKEIEAEIERLSRFPKENPSPLLRLNHNCQVIFANAASEPVLKQWKTKIGGYPPADFCKIIKEVFSTGENRNIELNAEGRVFDFALVLIKQEEYIILYGVDITARKQAEQALEGLNSLLEQKIIQRTAELSEANIQLSAEIGERKEREKFTSIRNFLLDQIAKKNSRREFLNLLAEHLKEWSGCSNVGIRVVTAEGQIPYGASVGFSQKFLASESILSTIHDQCACIRVFTGKCLPVDLNYITSFGSFFCNDTLKLAAGLKDTEKACFRGVCIESGYASVAVVPIRYKNKVIAAIHLADKEKEKVPLKAVQFIESLSALIGEGIQKFNLQERIRYSHVTQSLINSILRLSLEDSSIEEILQQALEKILSLSWFSFEGRGAIFLSDKDSRKLVLKAQKGLSEYLQKECDKLSIGRCICGLAALRKKTQFYSHVSPEHEITYKNMPPHGHYCVPILSKDKLIGVINIFLREGFLRDNVKEAFLNSIANALAGIIEYKSTQQELLKTMRDLNEAKRLSDIGTLAATVAHELRNPLGVVRTAAYNIKRKAQNPILDSHLANIEKKILESEQIISNLLSYSRIKVPRYEETRLYDLLDECVKDAQKRHEKLKVKLIRRYKPINSLSVELDPFQMREVFMNILNNAYEAVDEQKGRVEVRASLNGKDEVCIGFKDNGAGIDEENLRRISEPFFTTKARGTGLGLAVCYQVVNLHAGRIDVRSQKGKGTLFEVCLPTKMK